jgi:hypothetical protein
MFVVIATGIRLFEVTVCDLLVFSVELASAAAVVIIETNSAELFTELEDDVDKAGEWLFDFVTVNDSLL